VEKICGLYSSAIKLKSEGIHFESVDEKSGIQSIQRAEPDKPVIKNHSEKHEHEYIRHGTVSLIASFEVGTGQVSGILLPTRTSEDFLAFIKKRVQTDPDGQWIFIVDQLNTHKSPELVKWLAKECKIDGDLGVKRKRGILKSMKSRQEFLSDQNHRIRFVYTPKHSSWLNQIEIWFSILTKRLLKRLSTKSVKELCVKIKDFISFFNETMAKPFKWTYKGKVLQA
jgi:transposase